MPWGVELNDLYGPFQLKAFYDTFNGRLQETVFYLYSFRKHTEGSGVPDRYTSFSTATYLSLTVIKQV